ncbi:sensor histidine kinase [Candidatus Oscillochloris fontis]|uniref:sensor histidine kinase n=1 Tax=Candidatus Oscillochloris fontis TaxID=2496868 RepID=UPI00101D6376|nr:sensor histidine kinase [Candidatus Oscillochloris fontis]
MPWITQRERSGTIQAMESPSDSHNPLIEEETYRRSRLVLHTLPLLLFPFLSALITGFFARLLLADQLPQAIHQGGLSFFALVLILLIFSAATIVLVRLQRPTLSALLLIGLWTFLTTFAAFQQGVTTYLPALMMIPICAAGLLLDRIASVILAFLATVMVIAATILEVNNWHLLPQRLPDLVAHTPLISLGFWVILFWTIAILTALLAGGLQQALSQSRARAAQLAELSTQLEARVAQQTDALLKQAQETAALEERTRLAREIHDTLAQGLTGVTVQLGAARRAATALMLDSDNPKIAAIETNLDLAYRTARETLDEARRSVWNLRRPADDQGILSDALRSLSAKPVNQALIVIFSEHGSARPVPIRIEAEVLRIAQEALANVRKHAQATQATIRLIYEEESITLHVSDDGIGWPPTMLVATPAPTGSPWGGFGITGMRERIAALGGRLRLWNDRGAQIEVRVPLHAAHETKEQT